MAATPFPSVCPCSPLEALGNSRAHNGLPPSPIPHSLLPRRRSMRMLRYLVDYRQNTVINFIFQLHFQSFVK